MLKALKWFAFTSNRTGTYERWKWKKRLFPSLDIIGKGITIVSSVVISMLTTFLEINRTIFDEKYRIRKGQKYT